ncbi:MAG: hypothetical protein LBF93_06710 [Zoogloeaceae bacterium]|jgi:hypothetical protein|nr:hypothetical protein [Zoogloeaceae bacterium]
MISLTPLIARLAEAPEGFAAAGAVQSAARQGAAPRQWFRQVAGAAEFAQVRPEALPLPACWVIRAADSVRHAGERAEHVTLAFDVVIAITNARSHRPGETDDLLLAYREAVKTLLLGWEAAPDVRPLKFSGGRVLEYTEGDLYWADRYEYQAVITNYLPDPANPFDCIDSTGETL